MIYIYVIKTNRSFEAISKAHLKIKNNNYITEFNPLNISFKSALY